MYQVDILVHGFPGKSVCHGRLGWSTIALLRGERRIALVDVGGFGIRRDLKKHLRARGVRAEDVTDVLLTHSHHDHAVNWVLFPNAKVWIGAHELKWASAQPFDFDAIPELYVRELGRSPQLQVIEPGKEFLPGIRGVDGAGHTPGHLLFSLDDGVNTMLFTGDAGKNRAELASGEADATDDPKGSKATIARIFELWRAKPGTILVPGHDLSMRLGDDGKPVYIGERKAAIEAWFGESIAAPTVIDLCESVVTS